MQSDQSLCLSLEYFRNVKLLTKQHLEFLSVTGGCTGSSESIHVKIPHCWKSHVIFEMTDTGCNDHIQGLLHVANKGAVQPAHLSNLISTFATGSLDSILSYDVAFGSEIKPCNKIDKPLVVFRFQETLHT